LNHLVFAFPDKEGAQHRVTFNDMPPGEFERFNVQSILHFVAELNEISLRRRIIQRMEKQSLLHWGQRVNGLYVYSIFIHLNPPPRNCLVSIKVRPTRTQKDRLPGNLKG